MSTIWGHSSAGRAPAWHAGGQRFESAWLHLFFLVKPIYFTQFPRDLDNLQSVQLKKETFIKIVLPLIVAENEKILDDKEKLKTLIDKKFTTDSEKQWLRQKLLEYKVHDKIHEFLSSNNILHGSQL